MSTFSGNMENLASVLSQLLRSQTPAERMPAGGSEDIEAGCSLLVYSFLLWESAPKQAASAFKRLCGSVIDLNDLRVALPSEVVELSGSRDGFALERAERMRASLNDLFRHEHLVTLSRLETLSKREVREFLGGLEGMPSFVAARVTLLGFGGHAIPLDGRLLKMLVGENVFEATASLDDAERWLERQIRASDAQDIALLLDGWRDNDRKRSPKRGSDGSSDGAPSKRAKSKKGV